KLQLLCERKINEIHLDPPKFTNVTENFKETKSFEKDPSGEDYSNYEYTLELKKLTIPDFAQLFSQKDGTTEEAQDSYEGDYYNENTKSQRNTSLETMVFEQLRKNIEKIIWQVRVTVTNKETKYSFSLSTWVTNYNEKVQLNLGM